MDGDIELEMPSPKKMRLEASEPEISSIAPDDMDDLYGTPPARHKTPPTVSHRSPFTQADKLPAATSNPLHLPGLSLFDDKPMLSNVSPDPATDDRKVEDHSPSSTDVKETMIVRDLESEVKPLLEKRQEVLPAESSGVPIEESSIAGITFMDSASQSAPDMTRDMLSQGTKSEGKVLTSSGEKQLDRELQQGMNGMLENPLQADILDNELYVSEEQYSEAADPTVSLEGRDEAHQTDTTVQSMKEDGPGPLAESEIPSEEVEKATSLAETFEALAEANKSNVEAEFELDSSPYESSSSDSSSESSSSDDSSDDSDVEDYEMLSPEEEARRLMAEDGGQEGKVATDVPRTLNEKPDEVVPKPQVTITEDMKLEELGCVEKLVENSALVKAKTSGEYEVLESGSVLCFESRSIIGAVAETLGRVQQPYYSVRFTNAAAIKEAGIAEGTKVFYVSQFATTVFTQPLKALKGSDASNLHDEEVGEDELEFSDDEAEAEHKRQVKLQKRAKYDAKHGREDGSSRGPQQRPAKVGAQAHDRLNGLQEHPPSPADPSLNYDDAAENSDELYTPLSRPSNLHEMMTRKDGPMENSPSRGNAQRGGRGRGRGDRGDGRGRHRGNRGTGRGGRNDRGGQRSSFQDTHSHAHPDSGPKPFPGPPNAAPNPPNANLPPRPSAQNDGFHSHPQSQYPPMPPPSYPAHSSPHSHSHPSYPSQYPPSYNQPYPQQPRMPQHTQYPYPQGISQPHYPSQQAFTPPGPQYPVQQTTPITPSPAAIPPGAHINPNFFRPHGQQQPTQSWHQWQGQASPSPAQYQPYQ